MIPHKQGFTISPRTLTIWGSILSFFLIIWIFCFKMISPGYVGVIVDLFGGGKGVEQKEIHVGMHWIAPWKTVSLCLSQ